VARSYEELATFRRDAHDAIPPSARVEMIWELVQRLPWGSNATESRLDRSVGRVERRGRWISDCRRVCVCLPWAAACDQRRRSMGSPSNKHGRPSVKRSSSQI